MKHDKKSHYETTEYTELKQQKCMKQLLELQSYKIVTQRVESKKLRKTKIFMILSCNVQYQKKLKLYNCHTKYETKQKARKIYNFDDMYQTIEKLV